RHLVHEGTSRQAFDGLRARKRGVKNIDLTFGVIDHDPSTLPGRTAQTYEPSRERIGAMQENCREFGIRLFDVNDPQQGIVHVIATELGIVLPGMTVACGDSHTATNGAVGSWCWGIGTTEIERVLASQTVMQGKPKTMRATFSGQIGPGVSAKDLILHLIGKYGVAVGTGYAIEYAGPAIRALPMESRFTICNMSIEFGTRSGMIAADDTTFEYLHGRPFAPKGALWDKAVAHWRTLPSAEDATFDRELEVDCDQVTPQVTWGTSPQEVIGIDGVIPQPGDLAPERRSVMAKSLAYMELAPGRPLAGLPARLGVHRLVHQQPAVGPQGSRRRDPGPQGPAVGDRNRGAGLDPGEEGRRGRRARPRLSRGRLPVARIRLLDVPDAGRRF